MYAWLDLRKTIEELKKLKYFLSVSQICEATLENPVKSSDDLAASVESLIGAIGFLNHYHIKLSEKAIEKSRYTMGKILDRLQRSLRGFLKSLMPPIGKPDNSVYVTCGCKMRSLYFFY